MLFDRPGELPVATLRRTSRSKLAVVAEGLAQWVAARWSWLRPRTIPVTVAFLGMLAVIQSVNYLSNPPAATMTSASVQVERMGTMIFVDGKPYLDGRRMPDLESTGYRVRLVLQQ